MSKADDKIKLLLIAGARPNFMKIAPIVRALQARSERFEFKIVHTGQHYDHGMSGVFFQELEIPEPDFNLQAGGGSHADQTARIMTSFEQVCLEQRPDLVMVVGDVNSTLACSIVAKKLQVAVAHVEAGLRSGDRSMPEEINRLVTDSISDYFFVTERAGAANLLREGQPPQRIHFVGHIMIDNLLFQAQKLERADRSAFLSTPLREKLRDYAAITLHRPSNVDNPEVLGRLVDALSQVAKKVPIVFPIHPRTAANLEKFGLRLPPQFHVTPPMAYMDFLNLWMHAKLVLTDSGGLQEETTALGIPCLTLRENTERPITTEDGSNILVGSDPQKIVAEAARILEGKGKQGRRPELWDGKASERIVEILQRELRSQARAA